MGQYADKFKNLKAYEERVTPVLCKVLAAFACGVIILAVVVRAGFYYLTNMELINIGVALLLLALLPLFLLKSGLSPKIVKYFVIIDCILIVTLVSLMPGTDISIGYLLGTAVALIYLDTTTMIVASVISYVCMLFSLYASTLCIFFAHGHQRPTVAAGMELFKAKALSSTLEFVCLLPAFFITQALARKHLISEEKLMLELSTEEERYKLAFEGSRDVIFDYVYSTDMLTFYGSITDPGEDNETKHTVKGAFDKLSAGSLIHYDDIGKVIDLLNGVNDQPLKVRLCGRDPGSYVWIRIEGKVVYRGEEKIRAVGKVSDISEDKQKEEDFLEHAKKDSGTGFYTWDIADSLITRLQEEEERSMCFMVLKLMNLDSITEQYGSFFSDAIVTRISDLMQSILREDDYCFRLNTDTFIAIMVDADDDMITITHSSLEHSIEHIYTGETDMSGLDYVVRFLRTREELEHIIESESERGIEPSRRSNDMNYEAVSFAFNILEHSMDLSSSITMLLEYIGNMFNIVSIHIVERDETPGIETCIYDWNSMPGGSRLKVGERRISDIEDLTYTYSLLSRNDHIVTDNDFLARLSKAGRVVMTANHTSHLVVPIFQGGEVYGTVDYEHLNVEYEWPENVKNTLMEMTRCMSTYILRDRADSASRAKSDFLSSISHEIRTPLNAISGFSELMLADKDISDTIKKYALGIRGSSDNLLSIISGILDFSKIESGKIEILHEKIMMSSMLASLYQMTAVSVEEKGLEYSIVVDGIVPEGIMGDEQRTKQIATNLISNAVKFTNQGSVTVTFSFEYTGDNKGVLRMDVKDTGIGIRQEDIDQIFAAFEYSDKAKNKSIKGVGLGLSICRNLLHLMGGEIRCTSEEGVGSTFSAFIPADVFDAMPASFNPDKIETNEADIFRIPFVCPKAKVLIVDDNKVNLEVAKGLIGQYRPQITTVMSGDEALNVFFKDSDYDLIFMDHMMPRMDGIECVNHLRKLNVKNASDVPVVALTANAVKGARKMFISSGMNDYLAKPIKLNELADVMKHWIPDEKKEEYRPEQDTANTAAAKAEAAPAARTAPAPTTELIDFGAGLQNVLGSEETYKELLRTFLESDSLTQSQEFLDQKDIENYKISVHGLKSSARYIGAGVLSDKAKELEDLAKAGDLNGILKEHENLIPLYNETARFVNEYIGETPDEGGADAVVLSHDELQNKVDELIKLIDDMDFDAVSSMADELKSIDYEDKSVLRQFREGIKFASNFDFDEARVEFEDVATRLA